MKSGPVIGVLAFLFSLGIFLAEVHLPISRQSRVIPPGGAWKAFEWWYNQRAYPHALIPPGGLHRGYAQKATLRVLKNHRRSSLSAVPPWKSMGPDNIGGRVLSIAVHPQNTDTVWVGSASGGLWKTTTGGTGPDPWSYIATGYPVLSVSTIAIDPLHPDTMYIGTGEISLYERPLIGVVGARSSYGLGILKSTDGGESWDTTGLSWSFDHVTAVQKIVINPDNTSTLFAATSEGIYRSSDAGETWSVSNSVLMAMDVIIHPVDTTILISSHGNMNSSPDPGLYMTFDGGSSWSKLQGGLPVANFGRTSLSISGSNPSVVYAGISNGAWPYGIIGLYKSTNGGLTWTLSNSTNYVGSQGWYDNIIAVQPDDPSAVYCGGLNIHKTTDGGASLSQISAGSVHVDQHAIVFDPSDPNTVYFGCDGGIYKTTDGGTTFIDLNVGFITTQFYPGFANAWDDSTIAAGGLQDNGTLKYVGNPSWISIWIGDGGWCAINPTDILNIFAESQYGRIARSYNGGVSFNQVMEGLPANTSDWNFIPPFVMAPSDPLILYAGSRNVYRTTDQGTSWTASNDTVTLNGTNIACIGVSWGSADTLMTGTGSGTVGGNPLFEVFASTNGGASWSNVTGTLPDRYPTDIEFDPSDDRVAYLTYSGYGTPHVFRTTDLGVHWTDISANLPDIPVQAVTVDPLYPEYLYVGTDLGVFQSSDAGSSWVDYNEGMVDAMVLDLTISRANESLRAATFGNGVYERPLPRFPAVSLLSPAGGEIFVAGSTELITWSAAYFNAARIEFSSDGGNVWNIVADSIPASDGSYEWTVPYAQTDSGILRILNKNGGSPADSSAALFSILINPDVLAGWNMISVPFSATEYQKDSLYPTSVSKAYTYRNGYSVKDTLTNGEGYWLKFPAPQFTQIIGAPIFSDTFILETGWNMIGSISEPVPAGAVIMDPPALIISQIYEYRNGYASVDTILPGRGYWVKARSDGNLLLSSAPEATAGHSTEKTGEQFTHSLSIEDAGGFSQSLFFSRHQTAGSEWDGELPPPGPDPVPDARFAPDKAIFQTNHEKPDAWSRQIICRHLVPPLRVSWEVDNPSEIFILSDTRSAPVMISGKGSTEFTEPGPVLTLRMAAADDNELPRSFHLSQNYPNPFNPTTTIGFGIDGESEVSLTVYDLTGTRIAVLAEGQLSAGWHSVRWDASGRASGIYFYRLESEAGSITKKMMLLK